MAYTLIKKSTPNYWSRGGYEIVEYVIHHWGIDGQNAEAVANWLCNPRAGVSAHYVVLAGKVFQLLDESYAAWHAGNKLHNLKSIGIECRPEATEADYQTVAELIANRWKATGVKPLIRHKDIVATACPGRWDIAKLRTMVEEIYAGGGTTVKIPVGVVQTNSIYDTNRSLTVEEAIKAGQAWANKILGTNYLVDGVIGDQVRKMRVQILQWAMNSDYGARLVVDGKFGPLSKTALGNHYVALGETQYMVSALEILLLLSGYNPHGVERPGTFGQGCLKATKSYQSDSKLVVDGEAGKNTFTKLIA